MQTESMSDKVTRDRHWFEIFLTLIVLATAALMVFIGPFKAVVLHLFFLPIVLAGYFVGRANAGVLALLSVLVVTIVTILSPTGFGSFEAPVLVGLAVTIWGAVLGLTAILVGTLCDTRAATVEELHTAYVGVVEVLSKYLQGGNPHAKSRSTRIAELSQMIAEELKLPRKQVDDVRVAALLHDLGNMEITTQLITRMFEQLGHEPPARHTFMGTELVHSLGSVLQGAMPLLATQDDAVRECLPQEDGLRAAEMPLGAQVLRTVRTFHNIVESRPIVARPQEVVQALRDDAYAGHNALVLDALERILERASQLEPSFAPSA